MESFNFILIFFFGTEFLLIPFILYENKKWVKRFLQYLSLVDVLFFLVIGFILIIFSSVFKNYNIGVASITSFFFSLLSLSLFMLIPERSEGYFIKNKKSKNGSVIILIFSILTTSIPIILRYLYNSNNNFEYFYLIFLKNPLILIGVVSILVSIFVLIILGIIEIDMNRKRFSIPLSKKKQISIFIIFIVIFFVLILIYYYSNLHIFLGDTDNSNESLDPMQEGGNALSTVMQSIVRSPEFFAMCALVCIGATAKTSAVKKYMQKICDLLIYFVPGLFWIMVFIEIIPVPEKIINEVFNGIWFMGYTMYLAIYGTSMLLVAAGVSIFISFKKNR